IEAQTLTGETLDRLRRSFHGCDAFGSCVTVTVDLRQFGPESEFYEGTVTWRARFAKPGWIFCFVWPEISAGSYWEFGGGLYVPTLFESDTTWEYFRAAKYVPEMQSDV